MPKADPDPAPDATATMTAPEPPATTAWLPSPYRPGAAEPQKPRHARRGGHAPIDFDTAHRAAYAYCQELCDPVTATRAADEAVAAWTARGRAHAADAGTLLAITREVAARHATRAARPGLRGVLAAEHETDCDSTLPRLADAASGRLSDRDRRALDAHMSGCLRCQATALKTERAERAFRAKLKSGDEARRSRRCHRAGTCTCRARTRSPRPGAGRRGRERLGTPGRRCCDRAPPRQRPAPLRPGPRPPLRPRRSAAAAKPGQAAPTAPGRRTGSGRGAWRGRGGGRADRALEQEQQLGGVAQAGGACRRRRHALGSHGQAPGHQAAQASRRASQARPQGCAQAGRDRRLYLAADQRRQRSGYPGDERARGTGDTRGAGGSKLSPADELGAERVDPRGRWSSGAERADAGDWLRRFVRVKALAGIRVDVETKGRNA